MSAQGRLTVPAKVRQELHLESETIFEIEVAEGKLILTPAVAVPLEDAWAYTAEHQALIERAREDAREGRVYRLGRGDLERLISEADAAAVPAER